MLFACIGTRHQSCWRRQSWGQTRSFTVTFSQSGTWLVICCVGMSMCICLNIWSTKLDTCEFAFKQCRKFQVEVYSLIVTLVDQITDYEWQHDTVPLQNKSHWQNLLAVYISTTLIPVSLVLCIFHCCNFESTRVTFKMFNLTL